MPSRLYAHCDSYHTKKILITSALLGYEIVVPERGSQGSQGSIPVLETDGACVFGSNAILRHLLRLKPDHSLYGRNPIEAGNIDSWFEHCAHEFELPLDALVARKQPLGAENCLPAAVKGQALEEIKRVLTLLNNHLAHVTYLSHDELSFADISLCVALHHGMKDCMYEPDFILTCAATSRPDTAGTHVTCTSPAGAIIHQLESEDEIDQEQIGPVVGAAVREKVGERPSTGRLVVISPDGKLIWEESKEYALTAEFISKFDNVQRWFGLVMANLEVAKVLGE